jgi:hypothetical protein
MLLRLFVAGACVLCVPGCGDDDAAQPGEMRRDAGHDASSIPAYAEPYDGAVQQIPPDFVPPDAPDPILAHGDAAAPPAPATDAGSPPPEGCLALEPGDTLSFEDRLTSDRVWRRVDAGASCPVSHVSAYAVAYERYDLCPSDQPRVLEIAMLGADRIEMPPRESVADPMLVVYPDERYLSEDPFACVAINDDGSFDGLTSNSARIDEVAVTAGESLAIIATSHERPDQRGVGLFVLTLHAE